MASSGPNYPGTAATDYWNNPNNIKADDGLVTSPSIGGVEYLLTTNYGFNIPSGAVINGIVVEIEANYYYNGGLGWSYLENLQLVKGGTQQGTNKAADAGWQDVNPYPTFFIKTFGSSTNLWGLSWTIADINASNFGLYMVKTEDPDAQTIFDFVRITVYYSNLDCGFRYYQGGTAKKISAEVLIASHKLRIRKGGAVTGATYGIPLVATNDSNASPIRIYDGASIKSIKKYID